MLRARVGATPAGAGGDGVRDAGVLPVVMVPPTLTGTDGRNTATARTDASNVVTAGEDRSRNAPHEADGMGPVGLDGPWGRGLTGGSGRNPVQTVPIELDPWMHSR